MPPPQGRAGLPAEIRTRPTSLPPPHSGCGTSSPRPTERDSLLGTAASPPPSLEAALVDDEWWMLSAGREPLRTSSSQSAQEAQAERHQDVDVVRVPLPLPGSLPRLGSPGPHVQLRLGGVDGGPCIFRLLLRSGDGRTRPVAILGAKALRCPSQPTPAKRPATNCSSRRPRRSASITCSTKS